MSQPAAIVQRLHAALEAGAHGEELRGHFTANAVTIEHPNLIKPNGATTSLEGILANSTAGVGMLREQRYDVVDIVESGDTAIVRLTWTGVIGQTIGPFVVGQVLIAHIAQFVRVEDDRIASIETSDCYKPIASPIEVVRLR